MSQPETPNVPRKFEHIVFCDSMSEMFARIRCSKGRIMQDYGMIAFGMVNVFMEEDAHSADEFMEENEISIDQILKISKKYFRGRNRAEMLVQVHYCLHRFIEETVRKMNNGERVANGLAEIICSKYVEDFREEVHGPRDISIKIYPPFEGMESSVTPALYCATYIPADLTLTLLKHIDPYINETTFK